MRSLSIFNAPWRHSNNPLYIMTRNNNSVPPFSPLLNLHEDSLLRTRPLILQWRTESSSCFSIGQKLRNVSYWFSACLRWAHRAEVIWKPFQLVLSPSSHFNLSAQPHTSAPTPPPPSPSSSQPLLPGEAGVQWPRSVHNRPPWHASPSPLHSPLHAKNATGSETNIHRLYIIHGSCPGCRIKQRSITQPARSGDRNCPVQHQCGKREKKNSYFIQISYYINNERTLGLSGVFIFSLKQSL